ncbi:hypothetical protein [Streptomyces arenae]|uniref:hypothetical protein n=1 Tax=Streptomyces arenae TaxID=29301 RepID=UPI0026593AA8|nr:hypothetical protein [Streptomyces arenae]MCG7204144.1 hypothetical protein [Streptomyces arenae]
MTELSTEPVAVEAAPANPSPPPETAPAPAQGGTEVEHTPGGWPVVPLALSGANSTVGMVAATSLAGGPIAAAVAATGLVVLGTVAATRARTPNSRRAARRSAARTAGRTTALRHGNAGGTGRNGTGLTGSRGGRAGGRSGSTPGRHRSSSGPAARHNSTGTTPSGKTSSTTGRGASPRAGGTGNGKAAGRIRQIRALRAAQQQAAGSRAGQRAQTTAARRAVADARRNTNTPSNKTHSGKRSSLTGRLADGTARKARAARDAAVAKQRAKRDAKNGGTVDTQRARIRKAPARKAARQALRRSAARFHRRRLLAALLALPTGLLGMLTTPIGRKFDIPALMHPGRRLFRRLVLTAADQRAERDEATRQHLRQQEDAADAQAGHDGTEGIADRVERPAARVPTHTPAPSTVQVSEGEHVTGFRFEEAASEMEQAANAYQPDDCMEILAMVEGLPAALASVANVMKILAERSDNEFPLEKDVANGFSDIYGALMSAVAVAEDMGPLFRKVHAQDIARHEDPRNGTEAEKGWNV